MGARRLLLATFFVLSFCFATGCISRLGTTARSFHPTSSLDQVKLAGNSTEEPNVPSEQPETGTLSFEQTSVIEQNLPPSTSSKLEPPKLEAVGNISRADHQGQPKNSYEDSPVPFQRLPAPRADDALLDWVDKDLEKAFELPVEKRRLEFSKAVIEHRRVRYFIEYFSKSQKEHFATALARSGRYFPMISKVLREEGLPEELTYLALIESNFQTQAVSPSGAVGLWQFVPETARKYGLRINSWVDERRDPLKSTRAAAAYLKDLHQHFGKWYLATAAYNAGQGAIKKAMSNSGAKDFWSLSDKTVLKDETRNFVPKFVAAALIADNPQKYGFSAINYDPALEYDEVEVGGNLQLARLAEMTGTETQRLKELNPELLQNYTPPGEQGFRVKLPAGNGAIVELLKQEEAQPERQTETAALVVHEVRRGDTLLSIARRYGQEVRMLIELNGLKSSSLRVGQKLKVLLENLRGRLR
jgi:membrane-bound lytic murein transglycosylase D